MHLIYLHGSTLQSFWDQGKVRFLEALNPGGLFASVHLVNLDTRCDADVERSLGTFRFTAFGLAARGPGAVAKLRALGHAVEQLAAGPRPALVLADDANLLGWTAQRVARRLGVPYAVCIYYDNDLHYRLSGRPALAFLRSRALERVFERRVLRGAAGVWAGNRGYRDYGLRHGARAERTYLGTWSVDEIFYAPPPAPHPDARELLMVSRLHPLKFIDDVLAALARMSPAVRLDVAGEGPDRERLQARASSLGVQDHVRLLGTVPREQLLGRMQGARVLLATQGFSAVVEGLLSGRPLVAYDHECNAEVVRDGDTGLLVPFRDVDRLVQAVDRVLADEELGRELGRRGRARMIEECSVEQSIEHRRRFFLRCLGE